WTHDPTARDTNITREVETRGKTYGACRRPVRAPTGNSSPFATPSSSCKILHFNHQAPQANDKGRNNKRMNRSHRPKPRSNHFRINANVVDCPRFRTHKLLKVRQLLLILYIFVRTQCSTWNTDSFAGLNFRQRNGPAQLLLPVASH